MVVNFPFSNNENEKYFTVTGGHNEIVEDNCLDSKLQVIHDSLFMSHISLLIQPEGVEPSANVALSGTETIYREELVNANYDGQNYQLNIRAQDMPRGGSGNLAQERIQI